MRGLSIAELREGLSERRFSAVELARYFLGRIESHKCLNAVIDCEPEGVLSVAEDVDKKISRGLGGELLGVPLAMKDMILVEGCRGGAASKILNGFVSPYSATVARKLRDSGALFIARTNMDEFAMGSSNENSPFGPVLNPWNHERVSGGSSGGSAAAVAAGLVPAALGTDTGGSVRQPAAFCGVVGLKPTYGRVSRYGVIAFASSLDQVGCFAQSVEDCALVSELMSGLDPLDSTSVDREVPVFADSIGQDISGMRVGVPREYFVDGLQPEVREAVEAALSHIEALGARIVEVSLPHTQYAIAAYYIIAPAEAASNLSRYDGIRYGSRAQGCESLEDVYRKTRSGGFGPEVKRRILVGTYVLSSGFYDAYYLRAQKVRRLITDDFRSVLGSECDVIACPTAPTTAFEIGKNSSDPLAMYLQDIFTIPASLAGLPAMSIPCGFDSDQMPIGLQLIGSAWDESSLFRLGHAYEASTDWHLKTAPEIS